MDRFERGRSISPGTHALSDRLQHAAGPGSAIWLVVLVLPWCSSWLWSRHRAALRRRWLRRSLSPFAVLVLTWRFAPQIVRRPSYVAGLCGRFVPVYSLDEQQVAALPSGDTPHQVSFDQGSFGPYAFAVIYDESDRVAFPLDKDLTVHELARRIDTAEETQCWGASAPPRRTLVRVRIFLGTEAS